MNIEKSIILISLFSICMITLIGCHYKNPIDYKENHEQSVSISTNDSSDNFVADREVAKDCTGIRPTVLLDEYTTKKAVLHVGDTVAIKLADITSNYQAWKYTNEDNNIIKFVAEGTEEAGPEERILYRYFIFECMKKDSTNLTFSFVSNMENNDFATQNTFTIDVN